MSVNRNVDEWAEARVGIFFPATTKDTLDDGDLSGQCVSLVKWFLKEMTSVPRPEIARGDAKDYGRRLVSQGHAVQVQEADRRPGDIVVWEQDGGGYGHIGVLLSGDQIFEQNVSGQGSATRQIVSGKSSWTVHAARIDPLHPGWRRGLPTFYRVKTYLQEEDDMLDQDETKAAFRAFRGRSPSQDELNTYANKMSAGKFVRILDEGEERFAVAKRLEIGTIALTDNWEGQIHDRTAERDSAYSVIDQLREELAVKPKEVRVEIEVPVEKIVEKEVIKEVEKPDTRTPGQLVLDAIKQLFGAK